MPNSTPRVRCDQAVRPAGVNACCVNEFDPCLKPATHQHQPTGIALCGPHWENAMTLGGPEAGQWQVGMRILPFPDGWGELPQPAPDIEVSPPPRPSLWVESKQTAGGLIVDF